MSDTPSAVVDVPDPKLERMSRRTMPESSSTSTPLEPSPGNGPCVSSGTSVTFVLLDGDDALLADDPVERREELPVESAAPQPATSAVTPRPPRRPRARRRDSVSTS